MAVDDSLERSGIHRLTYHILVRHASVYCTQMYLGQPCSFSSLPETGFCAVEKAAFLIHVHVASSCFNDVVCMYVKSIRMYMY